MWDKTAWIAAPRRATTRRMWIVWEGSPCNSWGIFFSNIYWLIFHLLFVISDKVQSIWNDRIKLYIKSNIIRAYNHNTYITRSYSISSEEDILWHFKGPRKKGQNVLFAEIGKKVFASPKRLKRFKRFPWGPEVSILYKVILMLSISNSADGFKRNSWLVIILNWAVES